MSLTSALKHPTTGAVTIAAHTFGAALQLWAEGKITRAQALSGMKAPQNAEADLDAIAAVYLSKAAGNARTNYLLLLERLAIVLQTGDITAAQFKTFAEY